jgi:hypothetical protein
LQILAKLQEKGINSYEKAAQELKDTNEELYFYTPRHRVTVKGSPTIINHTCITPRVPLTEFQDRISSADALLLVVTPPLQAADPIFTGNFVDEVKDSESFFAKGKVIVLVKTPYDIPNHSLRLLLPPG